jgi:hypothetical protein
VDEASARLQQATERVVLLSIFVVANPARAELPSLRGASGREIRH